jgi:hypothetical protein
MYYKLYCNIFLDMFIIICDDLQDANKYINNESIQWHGTDKYGKQTST